MRFSIEDVQQFAAWSADRNPLHVDDGFARQTHFGQRIVHGVLTVFGLLHDARPQISEEPVKALDIEFRNAVLIGGAYETQLHRSDQGVVLTLQDAGQPVLSVRADIGPLADASADSDRSWISSVHDSALRDVPASHAIEEFQHGIGVMGTYTTRGQPPSAATESGLSHTHTRVLALCSYVTGMEVPGLKSLFTRLTIRFHSAADDVPELWYRARTTRFDPQFRILDTELQVVTPEGPVVATALLRSYVPYSPATADLRELTDRLVPTTERLRGKVALVLGGSRGLGADLTAALALAGCQVYGSARHDDPARDDLYRRLTELGGRVEFLQGDAGDPVWCESALETIQARHGRIDLLVLNACAPPTPLRFGRESTQRQEQYVRENLRLVETPLATFGAALNDCSGAVVYVSSSFVQETPPGFGHYVAVKQAGEGMVRTISREWPQLSSFIARPPVLQTRWNDTPTGVLGAIPADWVASHVVNRLAESWRPGQLEPLSDFPPFPTRSSKEQPSTKPDFAIRLVASFTTDPFIPALDFWMQELELAVRVDVAAYGQVMQSLLDRDSVLNARDRGINVVLLRVRDWLRELPDEQASDMEFVSTYLQDMARDFARAVRAHRAQAASETLLVMCPSYGARSSAESILVRETEAAVTGTLSGVPGLRVVSPTEYHGHYGVNEDEVHDPLRDEIAHIPYRDEYLHVLSAIVARHVYRRFAPVRKVVVVDCDNTLWRGVVGEVGAEGIEFDDGHRALHRTLERLSRAGMLVCLCSKNEELDVWRVFESRNDLLLRRDHVVAAMINWLPKSQNIRTLAARLNLGLDSFVFIDDNPVECAEVRAGCPEVLTIQWPQEPERALSLVQHVWEFEAGKTTKEDEHRTELYREEFRRQELRAETLTFADFIHEPTSHCRLRAACARGPAARRATDTADEPVQLHHDPARGGRPAGACVRWPARDSKCSCPRSFWRLRSGWPCDCRAW